jgi:hypothetical protein
MYPQRAVFLIISPNYFTASNAPDLKLLLLKLDLRDAAATDLEFSDPKQEVAGSSHGKGESAGG